MQGLQANAKCLSRSILIYLINAFNTIIYIFIQLTTPFKVTKCNQKW